jgi:hypothetical protein
MIRRREFLQIAPAAVTTVLAAQWSRALESVAPAGQAVFGTGIVNPRIEQSVAFGAVLKSHGIRITELTGDVGQLWYGELRAQLRASRKPLGGLTHRATLFCLEELARDVDMKVVARIDHVIARDGSIAHDVTVPDSVESGLPSVHEHTSFGAASGELLMCHAWHRLSCSTAQKRSGPAAPADTTALVTWVIA